MKKPRIGLALGSGGPKGLAHIGVLKALVNHNISVDCIAGSSAGALIGAFYCAKKNIQDMEQYILNKGVLQILHILFDPSFKDGLIRGKNFKKFLDGYLNNCKFDQLLIPFKAVAVEIKTGKIVQISEKDVATAVMASCGTPLFSPVQIDDKFLVDGAVCMPVPVSVVRQMGADIVIAVNLNPNSFTESHKMKFNIYSISNQAVKIMLNNMADANIKDADIVISPPVKEIGWRSLIKEDTKKSAIKAGELAMEEALPQLKKIISQKSSLFYFIKSNFFSNN